MQFGNPILFWLLLLVPALAFFFIWGFNARRRALARFASLSLAERLTHSVRPTARRWKAILIIIAVLLLVLALTQPRWGFEWREVKRNGVDVAVLLDVSKSMLTEDVRPNRLEQAKYAVQDLLNNLRGDRVGLIAFAGTAFLQCPLTVDYEAFRLTLKDADPRIIPRAGTAIGVAIRTALKAFEASEGRDRAIVLITDGEETEGDALAAADEAAKQGVKIYTIGVGTAEGELIPVREEGKPMEFLKDHDGQVVKSRLNEEMLKEIALKTGGIYVRSVPGDFGMDTIYEKGISQLKRKELQAQLQKRYFERFQWPLALALTLLVVESFLSDRRNRMRFWFLLFLLPSLALAKTETWPQLYNDGVTAYHSNDFARAAQLFESASASSDRRLQQRALYNLGNTTYRLGEGHQQQAQQLWQKAIKDYETALTLDPQDPDVKFNQEFVKKKLEELKKQQQQQQNQQNQQDKKQDQKKDDQQQKQQPQNDKGSKDQQQKPENQQSQQQKPDQSQEQPKPDQPKQQPEQKQEEQQEQQPKPSPDQSEQKEAQAQPASGEPENDQKREAAAMLDNLREDERNWNFFPEVQMKDLKDSGEPAKDW